MPAHHLHAEPQRQFQAYYRSRERRRPLCNNELGLQNCLERHGKMLKSYSPFSYRRRLSSNSGAWPDLCTHATPVVKLFDLCDVTTSELRACRAQVTAQLQVSSSSTSKTTPGCNNEVARRSNAALAVEVFTCYF